MWPFPLLSGLSPSLVASFAPLAFRWGHPGALRQRGWGCDGAGYQWGDPRVGMLYPNTSGWKWERWVWDHTASGITGREVTCDVSRLQQDLVGVCSSLPLCILGLERINIEIC